jgi:hypothetical protein
VAEQAKASKEMNCHPAMTIRSSSLLLLLLATCAVSFGSEETLVDRSKRVVSPYKAVFRGLSKGTPNKTTPFSPSQTGSAVYYPT